MNEIETFYGLVENTLDALRIFQMCQEGRLHRVRRRLHERERRLIRSGSVFVFDEEESGIRRWTDGRLWSPSRILGNFLIYRELERKGSRVSKAVSYAASTRKIKPNGSDTNGTTGHNHPAPILPKSALESKELWTVPRSEQSEDMKAIHEWLLQDASQGINPRELQPADVDVGFDGKEKEASGKYLPKNDPISGESLRVLKSKKLSNNHKGRYVFKENGLIKKTISIQLEGHTHHLVAYYSLEDFCKGHLKLNKVLQNGAASQEDSSEDEPLKEQVPFEPHLMEMLRQMPVPVDLMIKQNFRKPASYLAAATADAQEILSANPENGEKLITALEYGAINPSDLHVGNNNNNNNHNYGQHRELGSSKFVPGGGIIFFSSSFSIHQSQGEQTHHHHNPRPRRHSSFQPVAMPSLVAEGSPLDMLDESSQLSGEALEFFSQYSPVTESDELIQSVSNDNFADSQEIPSLPASSGQEETLETELFGSIFECSKHDEKDEPEEFDQLTGGDETGKLYSKKALRGEDIMLTEFNV